MKYGNEMGVGPDMGCAMTEPRENLAERMISAAELGSAVQEMAWRIRGCLFGRGAPTAGEAKEKAPECLEEELERHRNTLRETARTLEDICSRLGV